MNGIDGTLMGINGPCLLRDFHGAMKGMGAFRCREEKLVNYISQHIVLRECKSYAW